jgi:hypothetical protein
MNRIPVDAILNPLVENPFSLFITYFTQADYYSFCRS